MEKYPFKAKITKFILSHTRGCILTFTAVFGLTLLLFASFNENSDKTHEYTFEADNELEEYRISLENSLSKTVSKITGAGNSQVMITLEGSFETVYASNARLDETSGNSNENQKTTEKQLATTSNRTDGEKPIVVKKLSPKIKGVLIVCQGGSNTQIKNDVINAASTALNIPTSRIYVTGGTFTS